MNDKWAYLRQGLYGNTEPEIKLVALTCPGEFICGDKESSFNVPPSLHSEKIETLVADAATVSTGANVKDAQALIAKLIKMGHFVPTEFINYTFMITGISKSCSAQISRHRISSIVSASRRYKEQRPGFVYPLLDTVDKEELARQAYLILSKSYKDAYNDYTGLRSLGIKKGDCRYLIPVATATNKMWMINARSLNNFLKLRTAPDAEAEIRRLAFMIYDIVSRVTPTLFLNIFENKA